MKKIKRLILAAIFLIATYLNCNASIMGSDMGWSCLGGDSFLISVAVYNDCNSTAMGDISIAFKCATTGTTITTLSLAVPTPVDITPVCNSMCSRCSSSSCSFPYGIHKYLYLGIVHLNSAGNCCSINMSYSYGTRNSSITTGAAGAGFYTEAMMNRCQNPCDFSPEFTNEPVQIVCVGQDVTFNPGIIDSNNSNSGASIDSFTYEWAEPLSSANSPIAYTGQYAYNKSIYFWGFPNDALPFPRGLHLDPQTGDIQFRPMKAEVTVMVIQVNEFRNGVQIAGVRRDLQVIVITCTSNNPPSLTTPNNVRSKSVCAGSPVSFTFSTSDPNANDTITISWNNAIPGATWTTTNGQSKHPTGTLTWTPGNSQVSSLPYTFTVTAKDNACPISALYTQAYQITIKPNPSANIIVTDMGCGTYQFLAQRILGSGPSYLWQGQSFNFAPNTGPVVNHNFVLGTYSYSLTIVASGCSSTYFDSLVVYTPIKNILSPDTNVCFGSTVTLTSKISNYTGPVNIRWGSGDSIFKSDTTFTKTFTVTRDTIIWSVASDSLSCESKDSVIINMHNAPVVDLGADVSICSYGSADLKVRYTLDESALRSITWTDLKTNNVVDNDTMLSTSDSGIYKCTVTDTLGCTNSDTIKLTKNHEVIASVMGQVICYGDEAELTADVTGAGSAQYFWYDGTNLTGNTRSIKVKPLFTTDYCLKVQETKSGVTCKDSTMVRVRVNPLPGIIVSPIDKRCVNGSIIFLNNFVTVDGLPVTTGIWTSPSAGLIYLDKFVPLIAGVSTPPGWMVFCEYYDPATGCHNKDSNYVTVFALPQPYAGKDDSICSGVKISLNGTPSLPPGTWRGLGVEGSYPDWKFNPDTVGIISGGIYDAIYHYTDSNNCENEDTVKFTVNPPIPVPDVSLSPSDSFLECNQFNVSYNWFYSPDTFSTPTNINNNSRRINPRIYCQNCYYSVIYTNANGCVSDTSAYYYFYYNSIEKTNRLSGLRFYPNPAHNVLFAEYSGKESAKMMLTDILGNIIIETKINPGKNEINIQNYKPGVYFIFLDGMIAGKVLID